ncbi:MAG: spore protease YyaC [Clostridium sp.]|uniref:spore protease YyaC n=1 Tax=Clostridium sp. TaxID=1506 RepID=UPI0025C29D63|nr:spore protease YyaC [Clostridium sp.]MCH3965278.1 spore protease YyaC [Clostridium sp.]MCI1714499.1 spore protease YyaC [Clostridium sp.]MCI1798761.1 spore protease YyaC [Clostridium sp.]MCI1812508.1 spore protease YyaC [Clostridium sp.]MCI1869571.1 spore protease YyaC [Clostridium sp.]
MNKVKVNYKTPMAYYKLASSLRNYIDRNTIIVCIGTDRYIGDCLGPLVGTLLKYKHFPLPVYGTIQEPIHALNIDMKLKHITSQHKECNIIGIDACLGDINNIGEIQVRDFPIHPGKGVGKSLPNVGETSVIGIVDSNTGKNIFSSSNNIRLNLILSMSEVILNSLIHAYYLYLNDNIENI